MDIKCNVCPAGTHGSRPDYGNLAALVTRLKIVTGEGKILTLTEKDNNTDLFRAAQVYFTGGGAWWL